MITCVVEQLFVIVLERIRSERVWRQLLPGRNFVNYKYRIDDIDDKKDGFDNFEKVETTSVLDSANYDAAVLIIPYIADIISAVVMDVDSGSDIRESYNSVEKTYTIDTISATETVGV